MAVLQDLQVVQVSQTKGLTLAEWYSSFHQKTVCFPISTQGLLEDIFTCF